MRPTTQGVSGHLGDDGAHKSDLISASMLPHTWKQHTVKVSLASRHGCSHNTEIKRLIKKYFASQFLFCALKVLLKIICKQKDQNKSQTKREFMKLVSVRALSILLSLTLVIVTAVICLALSLSTGEDALKKTEASGNNGIDNAFITAEVNIKILADSLMNAILSTSVTFIHDWLHTQLIIVQSNRDFFTNLANTPAKTTKGDVSLGFFQWETVKAAQKKIFTDLKYLPTTGIFTTTVTGIGIIVFESTDSTGLANATSEFYMLINNGTDHANPIKDTIYGLIDENLNWLQKDFPCLGGTGCAYAMSPANSGPCMGGAVKTSTPTGDCAVTPMFEYDPMGEGYIPLVFGIFPEGGVGWTSIVQIGTYMGGTSFK